MATLPLHKKYWIFTNTTGSVLSCGPYVIDAFASINTVLKTPALQRLVDQGVLTETLVDETLNPDDATSLGAFVYGTNLTGSPIDGVTEIPPTFVGEIVEPEEDDDGGVTPPVEPFDFNMVLSEDWSEFIVTLKDFEENPEGAMVVVEFKNDALQPTVGFVVGPLTAADIVNGEVIVEAHKDSFVAGTYAVESTVTLGNKQGTKTGSVERIVLEFDLISAEQSTDLSTMNLLVGNFNFDPIGATLDVTCGNEQQFFGPVTAGQVQDGEIQIPFDLANVEAGERLFEVVMSKPLNSVSHSVRVQVDKPSMNFTLSVEENIYAFVLTAKDFDFDVIGSTQRTVIVEADGKQSTIDAEYPIDAGSVLQDGSVSGSWTKEDFVAGNYTATVTFTKDGITSAPKSVQFEKVDLTITLDNVEYNNGKFTGEVTPDFAITNAVVHINVEESFIPFEEIPITDADVIDGKISVEFDYTPEETGTFTLQVFIEQGPRITNTAKGTVEVEVDKEPFEFSLGYGEDAEGGFQLDVRTDTPGSTDLVGLMPSWVAVNSENPSETYSDDTLPPIDPPDINPDGFVFFPVDTSSWTAGVEFIITMKLQDATREGVQSIDYIRPVPTTYEINLAVDNANELLKVTGYVRNASANYGVEVYVNDEYFETPVASDGNYDPLNFDVSLTNFEPGDLEVEVKVWNESNQQVTVASETLIFEPTTPTQSCPASIQPAGIPGYLPFTVRGNSVQAEWGEVKEVYTSQFLMASPVVPDAVPVIIGFRIDEFTSSVGSGIKCGIYGGVDTKLTLQYDPLSSRYVISNMLNGQQQLPINDSTQTAWFAISSDGVRVFDDSYQEIEIPEDLSNALKNGFFCAFETESENEAGSVKMTALTSAEDIPAGEFPFDGKDLCGAPIAGKPEPTVQATWSPSALGTTGKIELRAGEKLDWGNGQIIEGDGTEQIFEFTEVPTGTFKLWTSEYRVPLNDLPFKSVDSWDLDCEAQEIIFYNCKFLESVPTELPKNIDSALNMFRNCIAFNQDLNTWDVSNITDMSSMFNGATNFNGDVSNWSMTNAIATGSMFDNCISFDQDLSNWDVSNVVAMGSMFNGAVVFNGNISNWNVSKVETFVGMFRGAKAFNQDISNWNVSSGIVFSNMFDRAESFNQDISGWDVSAAQGMHTMFRRATAFNQDLSGWCVSAFAEEPQYFSLDASAWTLPKPVWGTCPAND